MYMTQTYQDVSEEPQTTICSMQYRSQYLVMIIGRVVYQQVCHKHTYSITHDNTRHINLIMNVSFQNVTSLDYPIQPSVIQLPTLVIFILLIEMNILQRFARIAIVIYHVNNDYFSINSGKTIIMRMNYGLYLIHEV